MAYEPVEVIEVRCWGSRVGAVARDPNSGFYAFEYDPGWARSGVELAPLQMPVSSRTGPFVFPALGVETYQRLPGMIADALPDDFGNALITAYLANQGVSPAAITPLDRLAYLGSRAMGALEFRPIRGPRSRTPTAIEIADLVSAARAALSGEITTEAGITDALAQLIAVGTSAGGARAKAVVAINPTTGELRSGQVPARDGFEQWLLKLDGVGADPDLGATGNFGRIEYAYHLMALAAGIEMTECRLLEEGGRAHFMTRRYDRDPDGAKTHTQTLCALAHLDFRLIGAHDYAQLFGVIDRELGLGPATRAEVFRRMTFNVAAAICDDHTKNFSFLLPPGGEWRLSPAYDVTHAHAPASRWTHEHLMAVNGRRAGLQRVDLMTVADRFEVPSATEIVARVMAAVARWPDFAGEADVPEDTVAAIAADIETWAGPLRS